jgi:hypothetical protein
LAIEQVFERKRKALFFLFFLGNLFFINTLENREDENPNGSTKVNYDSDSRLVRSSNIFLDWLLLIDSNSLRAS